MAPSILIVRLGALGDLVHALPVAAALRTAWPDARIDWLVEARYRALLQFVPILDQVVVVGGSEAGVWDVVRGLRRQTYDVALDLQGLIKSAVCARLSGARTVAGFETKALREKPASLFYGVQPPTDAGGHVIAKNMSLLRLLNVEPGTWSFPLVPPASAAPDEVRAGLGLSRGGRFAIINPGAGWPNKQWPPERFGHLARHLAARHQMRTSVLWGPRERPLADQVVAASGGAAVAAPATGLGDVLALCREAALFVAGDTGPLQLAAAMGTPAVGIFGPTNPARNGPWSSDDVTVSRFDRCECHHKRACRRGTACIDEIGLDEVVEAVDKRLGQGTTRG